MNRVSRIFIAIAAGVIAMWLASILTLFAIDGSWTAYNILLAPVLVFGLGVLAWALSEGAAWGWLYPVVALSVLLLIASIVSRLVYVKLPRAT